MLLSDWFPVKISQFPKNYNSALKVSGKILMPSQHVKITVAMVVPAQCPHRQADLGYNAHRLCAGHIIGANVTGALLEVFFSDKY